MRAIIAIAGGTNMKGDIVTEDACRDVCVSDSRFEFCEMTGNLYAECCQDLFAKRDGRVPAAMIPYPQHWMKYEGEHYEIDIEDCRTTVERMNEANGHLGKK